MHELGSSADHSEAHQLVFDSAAAGWRALRVEEIAFEPGGELEFSCPPIDAQRIVLTTSGRRYVEAEADGRWSGAVYAAGSIGMTAPQVPTHLRWRSLDGDANVEVHVHLPGKLMRDVTDGLDPRARVTLPDALRVTDPMLQRMTTALLAAARAGLPDLYAESAAHFLAAHLLLRKPQRALATDETRVNNAIDYLRDNLQRPVTLAEVARSSGLSRYHFLRLFKQVTGRTPFAYLTELRVDVASAHLRRGRMSVAEVAYASGFSSHSALSTTFRRALGVTPSQYRKRFRPR